jgi:hypothetical protein
MYPAHFTPAGKASATGQKLSAGMHALGVEIVPEPVPERYSGEFAWVDAPENCSPDDGL